jgi:ATP-dependent DNA helicase RecG
MVSTYIDTHGSIRRAEVMELCRLTKDQAYKLVSRLKKRRLIQQIGERKSTVYTRKR